MALDEADHRLFVGVHVPPRLAVFDTNSGRLVAALPSVQDSDDLYFDGDRKRVYMPGGEGLIDVFQMTDPDHYQLLAKIPTAIGAKTAGYYGKQGKGSIAFIWRFRRAAANPPRCGFTRCRIKVSLPWSNRQYAFSSSRERRYVGSSH